MKKYLNSFCAVFVLAVCLTAGCKAPSSGGGNNSQKTKQQPLYSWDLDGIAFENSTTDAVLESYADKHTRVEGTDGILGKFQKTYPVSNNLGIDTYEFFENGTLTFKSEQTYGTEWHQVLCINTHWFKIGKSDTEGCFKMYVYNQEPGSSNGQTPDWVGDFMVSPSYLVFINP